MTGVRPADILRQLDYPAESDRALLARFIRERDQSAFAEIVSRHGPVVLGVCRRITHQQQDAEDAFQAAFLILARKAGAIANPDLLGNWLYGVAVRVARTARRSAVRRRVREVEVSITPNSTSPPVSNIVELGPIVDEELTALPALYREAIVLCDIRGVSREEAARILGVPEGTVSSRLTNGRKKLADRLTRRGIALAVAAIPTVLSATRAAAVPFELHQKTCGLVTEWMAGGMIPKPLIKLTDGGMTVRKTFAIGFIALAIAISGVVYATDPGDQKVPQEPVKATTSTSKTEVIEQQVIEPKAGEKTISYSTNPRLRDSIDINVHGNPTVIWSPQGDRIAVAGLRYAGNRGFAKKGVEAKAQPEVRREIPSVAVFKLNANNSIEDRNSFWLLDGKFQFVGCTADGNYFLADHREYHLISGQHQLGFWGEEKGEAAGGFSGGLGANNNVVLQQAIVRTLDLEPQETQGYAFASDSKTFRTVAIERDAATEQIKKITVVEVDATTGRHLKKQVSATTSVYALSSDGKRLATLEDNAVIVYDVDRAVKLSSYTLKPEVKAAKEPSQFEIPSQFVGNSLSLSFSPDGHRLVVCSGLGYYGLIRPGPGGGSGPGHGKRALVSGRLGEVAVLNADTGQALPALEDAEALDTIAGPYSLSHDGRLLALSGTQFVLEKEKITSKTGNVQARFTLESQHLFVKIWDTQTGKLLKTWNRDPPIAFNPARPLLAILEPNGEEMRLGFWDFSAEIAEKK